MRTASSWIAAAAPALLAAALLAGPTAAENPKLVGTVGPEFTIGLEDASGAAVTHLDPGTYDVVVHDRADIHNFHLVGPGVDVSTDIEFVGDKTFTVTFKDGSYTYVCDPHNTAMMGRFTVGTPPAAPTPSKPKLASVRVGPGASISAPARLGAGTYTITVRDQSTKDNVHVVGPGLNRKTGVAFRGTVRWSVTLRRGDYRVRSDAHTRLARTIVVS
jgi:plastocyanin